MGDPKKMKRLKKKKPPEGFVTWNEATFTRLIDAPPETLRPRLRVTHSMVLAEVEQGGDARARVDDIIDRSLQSDEEKAALHDRAAEIFATLIDAGVVVQKAVQGDGPNPATAYELTVDLPEDFALDQPLSPFLLAALELLDPESPTYDMDLISFVEATLEDPKQVLRAQERRARDEAMAAMKAEGVDFEERVERVRDVTYPKPLEEQIDTAYQAYCEKVPWARDFEPAPKSVLRDMLETGCDFKSYIQSYKIERCEGILLRYLAEAFRALDRTVPADKKTPQLDDVVAWLGLIVRSVDSSLVDEWAAAGQPIDAAPPKPADEVVADRRGLTVLVRNALFHRVRLAARDRADELGALDEDWGFGTLRWKRVLDAFYEAHDELLTDADARSAAYLSIDEADEKTDHVWHVHQVFADADGDHDFGIMADVDLNATQDGDGVVFKNYKAGVIEELVS